MRQPPPFETTTRLVARSLGLDPAALVGGFRRAGEGDCATVVAFRAHHFDDPIPWDDAAYLRWRYRFGRADRGLGDLWMLEAGGRLVGIVGAEDLVLRHAGARHRAIRTMDILIARPERSGGLGVWMNQAMFREAPVTLAVGANDQSSGTVRRLFAPLPDLETWILPIDIRWALRKRLGDGLVAAVATAVGNRALRLGRNPFRRGIRRPWSVRHIDRFDESVEPLLAPDAPDQVAIERGSDDLNYRLLENPRAPYRAAGLYRDDALVGYVAWRGIRGADGTSHKYVIDWRVARAHRAEGAGILFAHVAREGERRSCDYVLLSTQNAEEAAWLRRAGFIGPRKGRSTLVGLHARDPALQASLLDARWRITGLDDDTDGG